MTGPGAGEERPPRPGLRMLLRAAAAVTTIVLLTLGATATAGMLAVEDFADELRDPGAPVEGDERIPRAEAGAPQTILLVGSDRR